MTVSLRRTSPQKGLRPTAAELATEAASGHRSRRVLAGENILPIQKNGPKMLSGKRIA